MERTTASRERSLSLAAIAFALAVSAPAVRAQTPATEKPRPQSRRCPRPRGCPPARPAPEPPPPPTRRRAARVPIVGYELGGSRIDPDDELRALMLSVSALGDPFVESGPSDRIGRPFGTIPRLSQALDAFGYRAASPPARRRAG